MKIGILSDTHDQVKRTSLAVAMLVQAGAEALVHCGDITGASVILECGGLPGYFVFGNNDFDVIGLRRSIEGIGGLCLERGGEIVLDGKRIAIVHGDSDRDVRRLLMADPDYLLSGHTHRVHDARQGSTRRINPGALYRASRWTVAVLDLQTDHLELLHVKDQP